MSTRQAKYPINPIFIERWSPRAMTGEPIPDETLKAGFEAARWAPSSINMQPWRFVYIQHGSPQWNKWIEFLMESNRSWATHASALVILLSKKSMEFNGKTVDNTAHSFDSGAAWMSFALQMKHAGWATHAMGGIHRDAIRTGLHIPDDLNVEIVIAVGKQGDPSTLPEALRARENPSERQPLENLISEGSLKNNW